MPLLIGETNLCNAEILHISALPAKWPDGVAFLTSERDQSARANRERPSGIRERVSGLFLGELVATELSEAIAAARPDEAVLRRPRIRRPGLVRFLPGTEVDLEQSQAIASFIFGYQLPDLHPDIDLSVTAGVRYQRLTADVEIRPGLIPVTFSRERIWDWVDPIVGASLQYRLNDRWFVNALADVGGFGVGSDLTAQGFAAVGYKWTENLSTSLGYRAIYTDYDKNGFLYNVTQHGLYTSMALHF